MGMTGAERSRLHRARNPESVRATKAAYRERNVEAVRAYDRKKQARERARRRTWLDGIKVEAGCADCGYNDHPRALDFDHLGTDKVGDVGRMCHSRIAVEKILAEIAKCEVVCANCHRVRTWRREQGATPKPPPREQAEGQLDLLEGIA